MQETKEIGVQSLGRFLGLADPLKEGMAAHSSIPAWKIPWREEPGGLQSRGLQRVRHDWSSFTHTHDPDSLVVVCKNTSKKYWSVHVEDCIGDVTQN